LIASHRGARFVKCCCSRVVFFALAYTASLRTPDRDDLSSSFKAHSSLRCCEAAMLHRSPMVEPYGVLSALSQPHATGKCSSGAPRLCAQAHSPPFHQRGAALPSCMPLTDLCPPSCCHQSKLSAEKSGLYLLPLQASQLCRNLALPCPQLSLLPAARYTLWHCCLPILPCIHLFKSPVSYGDDRSVLR